MTAKVTIKDRVSAMSFDTLTQEDFDFLVERALKSVRPAAKAKGMTKAQKERQVELERIYQFVTEAGEPVTCADIQKEFGFESNQKAARALNDCAGLVKIPAQGKLKTRWANAEQYFANR